MDDLDFREVIDDKENDVTSEQNAGNTEEVTSEQKDTSENVLQEVPEKTDDDDDYEKVCFMCRRPESKVEKMLHIPGDMYICTDCMQRSFDMMGDMDFGPGKGGIPGLNIPGMNIPGITFVDLNDPLHKVSQKQRPKKQKNAGKAKGKPLGSIFGNAPDTDEEQKKNTEEPVLNLKDIPAPHKIRAMLDEYVIGQDYAKKAISVAVYNHYKRVVTNTMDEIEIEKSNMLLIGPSGCGKTYLVRTLARLLDVPLAITDATSLTEAGYIGDDIESVVSKLLAEADNDVEKAERGIIFIDEIDKIAKKHNSNQRDVSGESVQQGMLKLLEGSEVEVPVGANSKNAMVPLVTVNTRNILFICGGAFPDLNDIIKERLSKTSSIGFNSDLKDRFDGEKDLQKKTTVEDLRKFGMIPEFIGRLPVIVPLEALGEEMLVQILKEPKNAILKQYQKLLELDEVQLLFTEDAYHAIAKKAMERDTGARALRAVIEEFMLDIMYEIPKDDNIGKVTITDSYINGTGGPIIETRGVRALLETSEMNDK